MKLSSQSFITPECPIDLLEHQVQHVENILKILVKDRVFSYIDTSGTGAGKTFTTLYVAWYLQKKLGMKVMLVAPSDTSLNNDDGWCKLAEEFDIDIAIKTTYPQIRVSKEFLIAESTEKKKDKDWHATEEFEKLCKQGLFIIFDEFHKATRKSQTHFACAALVRAAKRHRESCRTALLSHTPGDKDEHYPSILRMTGLVTNLKLYKHIPFTRKYEYQEYGFGELAKVCTRVSNSQIARQRIEEAMTRISAARANIICKELYSNYLKNEITFAMKVPTTNVKSEMYNAFLETDEKSLQILEEGIAMLGNAVNWNGNDVGEQRDWSLGAITEALKTIERGKLASIVCYVRQQIKINPDKKFVICCGARDITNHAFLTKVLHKECCPDNYFDILQELRQTNPNWKKLPKDMMNLIRSYLKFKIPPTVLNGQTKKADRVKIIREFQADNDNSWCLVMTPGVGGEGLSLHDKHGNRPRELLIISDWFATRITQSCGRVSRVGQRSDSKVLIVYSKQAGTETRILDCMLRKTRIAKDLLAEGQKVVFPGEFPFWIQGKRDEELENRLNELRQQAL